MEESEKLGVIAAIIRRMKDDWPWLKRVQPMEGTPRKRDRCERLNFALRPRIPHFEIPLEYYSETLLPEGYAALWVEWIKHTRRNELRAMVWIIAHASADFSNWPVIRAGELPVTFQDGFHYAGELSNLENSFDRYLLPKNAMLMGQSELLSSCHYPFWRGQDLFALSESDKGLRLLRFIVAANTVQHVNTQKLSPGSQPWARYEYDRPVQYSPTGRYVAWADNYEKQKVRCITSLPDGRLLARIPLLEKQNPWGQCWINETQWVECRWEGIQMELDFYDVHKPGNVVTRIYSYNNTLVRDHADSFPRGTTGNQELLFTSKLRISLPDNRVYVRPIPSPLPKESGLPRTSPDGSWLIWHMYLYEKGELTGDPNFKPYQIWTSRPDGKDARLAVDMYRPFIGFHAWQPAFYLKADSRTVYTIAGGMFGDSLYAIS